MSIKTRRLGNVEDILSKVRRFMMKQDRDLSVQMVKYKKHLTKCLKFSEHHIETRTKSLYDAFLFLYNMEGLNHIVLKSITWVSDENTLHKGLVHKSSQ